ncbi:hypothetical protein [Candidatus Cyrtobacter comes]|nr:hypothetical protein [Candidatus Cyrtobacter comes]
MSSRIMNELGILNRLEAGGSKGATHSNFISCLNQISLQHFFKVINKCYNYTATGTHKYVTIHPGSNLLGKICGFLGVKFGIEVHSSRVHFLKGATVNGAFPAFALKINEAVSLPFPLDIASWAISWLVGPDMFIKVVKWLFGVEFDSAKLDFIENDEKYLLELYTIFDGNTDLKYMPRPANGFVMVRAGDISTLNNIFNADDSPLGEISEEIELAVRQYIRELNALPQPPVEDNLGGLLEAVLQMDQCDAYRAIAGG